MEVWQKEALLRHRMAILDDLHVDYVVDHLIARQILCEEHKESIFAQLNRRNRARYLLDLLPSLGPTAYVEFIASLKDPYIWLADALDQESEKTATNVATTSLYSHSNTLQSEQELPLNVEDVGQLLSSLSQVASTCGKSLCAIGDVLATLVQRMKNNAHELPSSSTKVIRQNSINSSMNQQQSSDTSAEDKMDRLRGGGGVDSHEKVKVQKAEEFEGTPSSLPLPEDSVDPRRETSPSQELRYSQEKREDIETVEFIIDSAYAHEDVVDGVLGNDIITEECRSNLLNDNIDCMEYASVEVNGNSSKIIIGYVEDNAEQFKTRPDVLPEDSPDSDVMGDVHLERIQEVVSLEDTQQNGMNATDESFAEIKAVPMDHKLDEAYSLPTVTSEWVANRETPNSTPILTEMERIQNALTDMTLTLRSVAQISEGAFKIASSIPN